MQPPNEINPKNPRIPRVEANPHASPPREIFARAGAAFEVPCRQTHPHPEHL